MKLDQRHALHLKCEQGIALLEALISVLIFSLGVLGIVGVQAAMIKHTAEAKYRSEASYIAQQRLGQMWADAGNVLTYLEADTDISTRLPNGTRSVTQPTPGQFLVTVSWQQPGQQDAHSFSTTARIDGGS
jgi:type IV pilus assembly protein PilV